MLNQSHADLGIPDESRPQGLGITRHFLDIAALASSLKQPWCFVRLFGISVVGQLLTAAAAWCVAQSASANLSIADALLLVPPVLLVTVLPLSIAGWGVREGAMVAAFAYAGLPQSDGLIVSLLFGIASLVLGCFGGIVWLLSHRQRADNLLGPERASEHAPGQTYY